MNKNKTMIFAAAVSTTLAATLGLSACTATQTSSSNSTPAASNQSTVTESTSNSSSVINENTNANTNSNTSAPLSTREKAASLDLTAGYIGQDGDKTYYCAVDSLNNTRAAIFAVKDSRTDTLQYYVGKCTQVDGRGANTVKLFDSGTGNSIEFQFIADDANSAQLITSTATVPMSTHAISDILDVIDPNGAAQ